MAAYLAVSTQYTNVTDTQPDRHRMTYGIGRAYAYIVRHYAKMVAFLWTPCMSLRVNNCIPKKWLCIRTA